MTRRVADALTPPRISGREFSMFGTTAGIWVTHPGVLDAAAAVLRSWFDEVDAACSRFRDDSDLSRANAAPGVAVACGPVLLDAVDSALRMAEATDGLCDPTVGDAVVAGGYDRSFAEILVKGPGPRRAAGRAGAWREVVVDRASGRLTVPAGTALDLGASAKGWAVDVACLRLGALIGTASGVCVSAGGDLAVAGTSPPGGWEVHLTESLDAPVADGAGALRLLVGAVATSGAQRRTWRIGDLVAHHLVDPRDGRPAASPWRLVTVLATRCAVADSHATAAWILGDGAPGWLASRGLTARLVARDGTVTRVGARRDELP